MIKTTFGNWYALAGDEANELGDAFLHRVLGVLCDLAVGRQRLLHDPADVGDRQVPVLLAHARRARALLTAALVAPARRTRRRLRHLRPKKTLDHCIHRVKNTNTDTHITNNLYIYIRITHLYVCTSICFQKIMNGGN